MSSPNHPDGKFELTLPPSTSKISITPHTSGNAQYINYCTWSTSDSTLVKWKIESGKIKVTYQNPNGIANDSGDVIIPSNTKNITIAQVTNTTLQFSYQWNSSTPIENSFLISNTYDPSKNLRIITLLAEDKNDHNYLDFQMVIVIHY